MTMMKLSMRLSQASVNELGRVIDWVQRPWAPQHNDRLRAMMHLAGRDPLNGAREDLASALVTEVATAGPRDLTHIGHALGIDLATPTADDVARAITARLGALPREPSPREPWCTAALEEGVAWAIREFAGAAVSALVRAKPWAPPRRQYGRHHGRRHGR